MRNLELFFRVFQSGFSKQEECCCSDLIYWEYEKALVRPEKSVCGELWKGKGERGDLNHAIVAAVDGDLGAGGGSEDRASYGGYHSSNVS